MKYVPISNKYCNFVYFYFHVKTISYDEFDIIEFTYHHRTVAICVVGFY